MFQTEGEYRAAALDGVRKLMFHLGSEACKPILAVTRNKEKNYEPENEPNISPLKSLPEFHTVEINRNHWLREATKVVQGLKMTSAPLHFSDKATNFQSYK